jgi:N-acetylneuraminate synthase
MSVSAKDVLLFENLFVLEAANNHWGSLERGLKLVQDFGIVVRYNNVKAAIKFQFRDVDSFVHRDFKGNKELRYISKTEATAMQQEQYGALVRKVREVGCIPMATPFDEKSVELCVAFDLPILKVASSDINDWLLLEAIARTKRPVIISSGGASEKSLDEVVQFFENRSIPIAINHCVSIYPSEDDQLELDQIDYLKNRYSDHVIGFSSHEYNSWDKSMYLSYAKGARTWERHIDIDYQGVPVSPYCSKPENIDQWFKAFHDANKMCGDSSTKRRVLSSGEVEYLDALVRGVYARNDLLKGYVFQKDSFEKNFYMAVPLQKGQLSAREVLNGEVLVRDMKANAPLMIHDINGPFAESSTLRKQLENRGLDVQSHSQ